MGKTIILTEKPSVARDFANALSVNEKKDGFLKNDNYIITWAIGHLVELFEPDDYDNKWKKWNLEFLPIIPEFFKYKPIEKTQKQLNIINSIFKNNEIEKIVIATDAGREGEVIARTILLPLTFLEKNKIFRFWTSQALTSQVIKEGMENLKPSLEYDRLWKAGQSRQIADWLVGMNGSRAATVTMKDLFSVGRVQTSVLALIVDRRIERENFKPEPYWILKIKFSNDKGLWIGNWFKGEQSRFDIKEKADEVINKICDQTGDVTSVKKQKKKQPPFPLYSLTDLQRDANIKFGFSAKKTLDIAQGLYENKKCLSYPRTDSKVLGTKNISLVQAIIDKLSSAYQPTFSGLDKKLINISNKRVFNDAKLTDHHALIPLSPIPQNSTNDEQKIFDLVLKRFAAAFYPDCEYEQTDITTKVKDENFKTRGKRILKQGWLEVYGFYLQKEHTDTDEEEQDNLPPLSNGDLARVEETNLEEKKTQPQPEYSEALLLKDMTNPGRYVSEEELKKIYKGDVGLGTQATRAQIIETLLDRKYVERKKKQLLATDKGCFLIEKLRQFETAKILTSPEETARWELNLEQIAYGQGSEEKFLLDIKKFVEKTVEEFKNDNQTTSQQTGHSVIGTCPKCGGTIIEGKKGYGCLNFKPEKGGCKFVIWKEISGKKIMPQLATRLLFRKTIGPLDGFVSEDNTPFIATIKLIQENNDWKVELEKSDSLNPTPEGSIGKCPMCGGDIVERSKGYGCSNWRGQDINCSFVLWKSIAGRELQKKEAIDLITKGATDLLDNFISKKGTTFSAVLKLDYQNQNNPKVIFDFQKK